MLDVTKRYFIKPSKVCSCKDCQKFKNISFLIEANTIIDKDYFLIDDVLKIRSISSYPENDLSELCDYQSKSGSSGYIGYPEYNGNKDKLTDKIDKDELWKL